MAEPYLSELKTLVAQACKARISDSITCKHFFSGAAAFLDGKIFMSLSPVGLALKLSDEDCNSLINEGATPLRYFPKAPIKKGYVILPDRIAKNRKGLPLWIMRSIAHTGG